MSRKIVAILLAVMMIVPMVLSPAFAETVTYTTARRFDGAAGQPVGYSAAILTGTHTTCIPEPFHLMTRIVVLRTDSGVLDKHASIAWTSGGNVNFGFDLDTGKAFISEGVWNCVINDSTNVYCETPFEIEENTYYQIDWFVSESNITGFVNGTRIISYTAPEGDTFYETDSYIICYPNGCSYDILDTVVKTYDDLAIMSASMDDWDYYVAYSNSQFPGGYFDAAVNYTVEAYNIVFDAACDHLFGEWTVTTEPSCTESGLKSHVCSRCGVIEAEYIPPFGHNYEESVIPATIEHKGYVVYTCLRCGDTYSIMEIPDPLHDWSDWVVTTPPTCGAAGVETRTCSDCDEVETRLIPPTGNHNYVNGICTVCLTIEPAHLIVSDATAHADGTFDVTLSLTNNPGITTLVVDLTFDNDVLTFDSAANGGLFDHMTKGARRIVFDDYPNVTASGDLATLTFSVDGNAQSGSYTIKASTHDASDENYDDVAVDSIVGTVDVTAHDFGAWTVTTPASCTTDGFESHSCYCGVIEGRIIEASGHDWSDWTVTTPATCGAAGVETRVCANNASHIETRAIPATGEHFYLNGFCVGCGIAQPDPAQLGVSDATAHADGTFDVTLTLTDNPGITTLIVDLTYDQSVLTLESAENGVVFEILTQGARLVFDNYPNTTENGDLATLTFSVADDAQTGSYTITASTNDASDEHLQDVAVNPGTGTVAVTAHSYGEWTVVVPADCVLAGIESRSCACGAMESRRLPASGHEFGEWIVTTHATCTADGTESRYCANCEAVETRTLPATGHDFGDWVVTTPALCSAPGVETRVCANDASHIERRAIPATGHNYGEWTVTTPATCGAAGVETRVCANNASHIETRAIPATGAHTFAYGVCTVCGALDPNYDPNAPASPKLTVSDATVPAGSQVTLTVSLVNNPGLTSMVVKLDYDHSALTLDSVSNGALFESMTRGTNLLFDNYPNTNASGALATLTFTVASDAVAGDYTVRAYTNDASNENLVSVILGSSAGTVTVTEPVQNPAKLVVSDARARANDQFQVTVSIENNPGIAGLVLKLDYDTTALTLDSVTNGDLFSGFEAARQIVFDEGADITADGLLMTLTFTVNSGAADGDYAINVIVREATNEDLNDITLTTVAGNVEVYSFIYGDANNDGQITTSDAVAIRRYIASFDESTGTAAVNVGLGADVNADGVISIKDVVLLRKFLASYDETTGTADVVLGPQQH